MAINTLRNTVLMITGQRNYKCSYKICDSGMSGQKAFLLPIGRFGGNNTLWVYVFWGSIRD